MRVRDVMTPNPTVVQARATLEEAAAMMALLHVGPLPVVDQGRLVGVLTDRDIVVRSVAAGADPVQATVAEAMTADAITCGPDDGVAEAAELMKAHHIRRLVVVGADGRPVGMVSLADLVREADDEQLVGDVVEQVSEPAGADQGPIDHGPGGPTAAAAEAR